MALPFTYVEDEIKIDRDNSTLTNIRNASFKNNTCFIGDWIDLTKEYVDNNDDDDKNDDNDNSGDINILKIQVNVQEAPPCFFIGMAPSDDNTNESLEKCCDNSYALCGNGRIYFNQNEVKTIDDIYENDILELILYHNNNINDKQPSLKLKMNNKDEIILFDDIIKNKYKFAVSICYAGDKCTLLEPLMIQPEPTPTPTPPPVVVVADDNNDDDDDAAGQEQQQILQQKESDNDDGDDGDNKDNNDNTTTDNDNDKDKDKDKDKTKEEEKLVNNDNTNKNDNQSTGKCCVIL